MRALVVALSLAAACTPKRSTVEPPDAAGGGAGGAEAGSGGAPPPLSAQGPDGRFTTTVDAGCPSPTSPGPHWRRLPAYLCHEPLWVSERPDLLPPLTFADCGWAPACRWLETPWLDGTSPTDIYPGFARVNGVEYLALAQLTREYEQVVVSDLGSGGVILGALRRNKYFVGAFALGAGGELAFLGQEGVPGTPSIRYQVFWGSARDLATYLAPQLTVTTSDSAWGVVQMPLSAGSTFLGTWFAGNAVARVHMPEGRVDVVVTAEASWGSKQDQVAWRDTLQYVEEERRVGSVRGAEAPRIVRELPEGMKIAGHARDDEQVVWLELTEPWGLPTTHTELWTQPLADGTPTGAPTRVGTVRGVRQGYYDRRVAVGGGRVAITAMDLRVYDVRRRTVRVAPPPPSFSCVGGTQQCTTTWLGVAHVDATEVIAVQHFGARGRSIVRLRLDALPEYPMDSAPEPVEPAPSP